MGKTKQTPAPVQDEEYEVERICGKQFQNKENCYEVKWKNFPITENTWEPASNLDCDELIAAYEASLVSKQETAAAQTPKAKKATTKAGEDKKKKTVASNVENMDVTPPAKKSKMEKSKLTGFARGLTPEKIVGATDSGGQLTFLIKWIDSEEADLVPSSEANEKCPQIVIRFYEERLTWHQANDS